LSVTPDPIGINSRSVRQKEKRTFTQRELGDEGLSAKSKEAQKCACFLSLFVFLALALALALALPRLHDGHPRDGGVVQDPCGHQGKTRGTGKEQKKHKMAPPLHWAAFGVGGRVFEGVSFMSSEI
jgi:hypothetical protein